MSHRTVSMLLAAAISALIGVAQAQGYPGKPIRIVTTGPGSPIDLIPRLIQPRLAEYLGQPIVIETKAGGAALVIITDEVARAAPDGYTLLSTADVLSVAHHLLKQIPYDGLKAFAPVTRLVSAPPVLAANPAFPPKNLSEFIAYARANPGKVTLGSPPIGSRGHIAAAVLASEAGLVLTQVSYKGPGPLVLALVSGDINAAFLQPAVVQQYVRAEKIKLLAVAGKTRLSQLPDVRPVAELIPGFDVISWFGILAPAKTPKDIVARLHQEFTRVLALPDVREKIAGMGLEVDPSSSPEEFGAFIQAESAKFGKIIRQYNIRAD